MSRLCPCTSGEAYKVCCQPYHNGKKRPLPRPLMRSRYAAYALGKVGYILKTEQLAEKQKDAAVRRRDIKQFSQNTQFVGLQILDEQLLDETHATVTFHAILLQSGHDVSYTEKSLFEKVNGRWLYIAAT
ncbi:MAG: YchJ family metal-binding protein [Chloroflexota bacterium]